MGNLYMVTLLLSKGADVKAITINGTTPLDISDMLQLFLSEMGYNSSEYDFTSLKFAVIKGQFQVVNSILSKVNINDKDYCTTLDWAVRNDKFDMLKLLWEKGTNANAKDKYGYILLHWALPLGKYDIINLLLEGGADIEARNKNGQTPLFWAMEHSQVDVDIVKLLLDRGANYKVKDDGYTFLRLAFGNLKFDIVRIVLEKGANAKAKDENGYTPLDWAVECGNHDIVKIFREKEVNAQSGESEDMGKNINNSTQQDEGSASKSFGNSYSVRGDVDRDVHTATYQASSSNTSSVTKQQTDKIRSQETNGSQTNVSDDMGIHKAAKEGNLKKVKFLIESKGVDVNLLNERNHTPLHTAARKGRKEIVEYLLHKGANIEAKNKDKTTPLHLAIYGGNIEVIKCLIDNNADIEAKQKDGYTPLILASYKGYLEVVKYLLENKAKINARDKDGNISLHYAAQEGHLQVMDYLLNEGADKDAKTNKGANILIW